MAYTVPRVEITQEFINTPVLANNPLSAFIFGPNYALFRYDQASEKQYTALTGTYSPGSGIALQDYPWRVNHPTARVDATKSGTTYTAITPYIENGFGLYFGASFGLPSGGNITAGDNVVEAIDVVTDTKYEPNKLLSTKLKFATSVNPTTGAVNTRSAYFSNRDVQVGDWVLVTGTRGSGGGTITIFTQIVGIEAASASDGIVNVLKTADRIFDVKPSTSALLIDPTAADVVISLFIQYSGEMPNSFLLDTTSSTQVGVIPNGHLTDPNLIATGGGLASLTLTVPTVTTNACPTPPSTKVFVSYRVLRTDNADQIRSLTDASAVETALGPITPLNPLAQGVYDAALNSAGIAVYYMAVASDDLTGYNKVLEQAKRVNNVYGLVPLSDNGDVIDAVIAHVQEMSTASQAKWRKVWVSPNPSVSHVLAGYEHAAAGNNWVISAISANPLNGDTGRFIKIAAATSPSSFNPAFLTNDVRAGDILRVFDDGGITTTTFTDYPIVAVSSQNELLTDTNVGTLHQTTDAVQIIRLNTVEEQIALIAGATTTNSDVARRVNVVFPNTFKNNGVTKAGYFLAAALSGLRSGSLPHRPLTNVQPLGVDDVSVTVTDYTPTQLDTLASYGVWIVAQDVLGGAPYVRHQLTSAGYSEVGDDPKFSEDSITTNVDSISYGLQRALAPYIGRYNVNPATAALVETAINRQLNIQRQAAANSTVGPQLLGYKILRVGPSATFRDRIESEIELTLPFPLNKVTVNLLVV